MTVSKIPYGYCQCGCGEKTRISPSNCYVNGYVKGEPRTYLRGHATRLSPVEYLEEDRGHDTPCWIWQRSVSNGGYGSIQGGYAHRMMYERLVGPIPDGLYIDHLCRVPACVNPEHLEPVTPAENVRRGYWGLRTHCNLGHEFTPENTYINPRGSRQCKTCARASARRSYWRARERAVSRPDLSSDDQPKAA